jgi:membrane protein DedA with SNARE-associated domain
MGITEWIAKTAVAFIAATSYPGIFLLMVLESMVFPVPSEAVMPFAGFQIVNWQITHTGPHFTFIGVIIASTLGSIVGSLASYAMGFYGGKPFIKRFGKYLLLDTHDLEITERFFAKRGELTIFISRFIPIIRHMISIPAGLGKMNIWKFIIYTILGAGMWNAFLTFIGIKLKENWEEVMKYSHTIDIVVVAVLGLAFLYYAYKIFINLTKKNTVS